MMSSCYSGFSSSLDEFECSSTDSGFEKSYESISSAQHLSYQQLNITGNSESDLLPASLNHNPLVAHTTLDEFTPNLGMQTSTPVKAKNNQSNKTTNCTSNHANGVRPKRKYAVGKNRMTRTRSPTQVMRIKKTRRIKANDRERNRMHTLNEALERLRLALPTFPEDTKLTKIETLRFAHNYIFALEQVLQHDGNINLDLERLQSITLSGEPFTKELFDAMFVHPNSCQMNGFTTCDFLSSMQTYHSMQQQPTAPPTNDPSFSRENYDIFRGAFETAMNSGHSQQQPPHQNSHHHNQETHQSTNYMPTCEDLKNFQPTPSNLLTPEVTNNNNFNNFNHNHQQYGITNAQSRRFAQQRANMLQSSSFYAHTPPWKEYNEHVTQSIF